MFKRHSELMLFVLRASDMLAAGASAVAAHAIMGAAHRAGWAEQAIAFERFHVPMVAAALLAAPVYARFGLYEPKRFKALAGELPVILRAVIVAWCLMYVAASLLSPPGSSRMMLVAMLPPWLVLAALSRSIGRILLHQVRRAGFNLRHAAIVGTGRLAQTLFHTLRRNNWTGIEVHYFIDDAVQPRRLLGRDVLGGLDRIESILQGRNVDMVFVALPPHEHQRTQDVLNRLACTRHDVRVVPDMLSYHFLKHEMEQLDNLPIVTLTYTPLQGWNALLKRAFDVVGAAAGLVLLAPLLLAIAVAVRLGSRGPVFYRQIRASLGGKPFRIVKFRTMVADAERQSGPVWAAEEDPRATPLGRLLRRTNLDELPQLYNVLRGDMSLVGPRPERPELVARFRHQIPRYMLRHHAKAGLTGWAQIHGLRGQTSLRKRVQYDMFYICNWSFGLDLRILAATLAPFLVPQRHRDAVLRREQASAARALRAASREPERAVFAAPRAPAPGVHGG